MSPQNLFHDIMDDEKKNRLHLCADLLQYAEADENLIRSVLMISETWVNGYNVKLKQQSSQWKSKDWKKHDRSTWIYSLWTLSFGALWVFRGQMWLKNSTWLVCGVYKKQWARNEQNLCRNTASFFNKTILLCTHAIHPKVSTRKQNFIVF